MKVPGPGTTTDLRSLPLANWSLALEHSPARPDFSHAVHAGSLPSHFKLSDSQPTREIWFPHLYFRCTAYRQSQYL